MNHRRRRRHHHHHRHHPHPHPSLFVTSLDNPGPVDEHMGLLGFSCWLLSPSHHNQADSLGTAHKHLVKNHLGHTDLERVLNISVARLHRLHHLSECLLATAAYDASYDMDWHGWFVPAPEQTWELAVSVSVSISGAVEFSSISGTTTHSTKSKSVMHAANPAAHFVARQYFARWHTHFLVQTYVCLYYNSPHGFGLLFGGGLWLDTLWIYLIMSVLACSQLSMSSAK